MADEVEKESDPVSVLTFFQAAKDYWRAIDRADSRSANRQNTLMKRSFARLSDQQKEQFVLNRIEDSDAEISLAVAAHCIKLAPAKCLPALHHIEKMHIPPSLSARILIDLWNTGRL